MNLNKATREQLFEEIRRLQQHEQHWHALADAIPGGVGVRKLDGTVVWVNRAMCEIMRCKPEDVLGSKVERYWADPEQKDVAHRTLAKEERFQASELQMVRPDGSNLWVDLTVVATEWEGLPAYMSLLTDVAARREVENALKQSRSQLAVQNEMLHHKNLALKELMGQVELQKKRLAEAVQADIEQFVLPPLERLSVELTPHHREALSLVQDTLAEVTSAFGIKLCANSNPLSKRETEIAGMIRKGRSSRQIADILRISPRSVELHRYHIRKKLGLVGTTVNLATHLQLNSTDRP